MIIEVIFLIKLLIRHKNLKIKMNADCSIPLLGSGLGKMAKNYHFYDDGKVERSFATPIKKKFY